MYHCIWVAPDTFANIVVVYMNKIIPIVGFLGIIASLPIFRGAGHSRHDGVSFWRLLYGSTNLTPDSPFGHAHLPYEEAVGLAQQAYQEALLKAWG